MTSIVMETPRSGPGQISVAWLIASSSRSAGSARSLFTIDAYAAYGGNVTAVKEPLATLWIRF